MKQDLLQNLEAQLQTPQSARIYALFVERTPVLLFAAESLTEARQLTKEAWLHEELRAVTVDGQPLASPNSKIWVARASSVQEKTYRDAIEGKPATDEIDLVYLVAADQTVGDAPKL